MTKEKKKIIFITAILAVAFGVSVFLIGLSKKDRIFEFKNFSFAPKEKTEAEKKTEKQAVEIERAISSMSLQEKIGQLVMAGLSGKNIDSHARILISKYRVGGFNLLGRNVSDYAQTKKLISDLQTENLGVSDLASSTTLNRDHKIFPLLIGADQEGGEVIRFNFLEEKTPELRIDSASKAKAVAEKRGKELCALGVNAVFSPVIDYVADKNSYLYNRTFGTTSEEIGKLGFAMVLGYEKAGIISVPKHFPGYGDSSLDPHKKKVSEEISAERLSENLSPFGTVVFAGARAIMSAHIILSGIEEKPATLSPVIIGDWLRKKIGFKGVIFTDDIEMTSLMDYEKASSSPATKPISAKNSTKKSPGDLAVEAILAGNDIIISTYTESVHIEVLEALKDAVVSGRISQNRLDESIRRVLELKMFLLESGCGS